MAFPSDYLPELKKKSKKVLHFSDGILEEYSSDEEQKDSTETKMDSVVDPSTLSWGPYCLHVIQRSASSTLAAIDHAGEGIANFLGITSPKYYYEIEEYKRIREEEEAEQEEKEAVLSGWTTDPNPVVATSEKYSLNEFQNKDEEEKNKISERF